MDVDPGTLGFIIGVCALVCVVGASLYSDTIVSMCSRCKRRLPIKTETHMHTPLLPLNNRFYVKELFQQ